MGWKLCQRLHTSSLVKSRPLRSIRQRDPAPGGTAFATNFTDAASGATIHRWEFADVPQAFPEPDMPSLYTCVHRLLLSTEADWRDLSRWYDRLCQPRLELALRHPPHPAQLGQFGPPSCCRRRLFAIASRS